MKYSYIAIPHYYNALNEYRLEIGYQLFEKYGWIAGERYCSTILPLDQWAPEDREALIDLYQSANPEYLRRRSPPTGNRNSIGGGGLDQHGRLVRKQLFDNDAVETEPRRGSNVTRSSVGHAGASRPLAAASARNWRRLPLVLWQLATRGKCIFSRL